MSDPLAVPEDTIAAQSTAAGCSGIGVIRISGPDAVTIADRVFKPENPIWKGFPDRKAIYGKFILPDDGTILDDGVVVVMRGPNSFTGEDVAELSLHGSPVVLHRALVAILDCGARHATRGEFTRRAFLNGKLDLTQAEAVIDLITAPTASAAQDARSRLDRGLSDEVQGLIQDLTNIIAEIEANIDFAEDLETELPPPQEALIRVHRKMRRLIQGAESGRYRREGIKAAIVGKPNVGKSTLFNALLGEERMITTPHPGTTRDSVSETIVIDGTPFVICDTAGLRNDPDPVENEGIKRTMDWIGRCDLVLMVFDASLSSDESDQWAFDSCQNIPKVLVFNKSDLPAASVDWSAFTSTGATTVNVSAKNGTGLDALRMAIFEQGSRILSSKEYSATCTLNQRGLVLVESASSKVESVLESISAGHSMTPEILSLELNAVLKDLLEITGDSVDEAVLNRIFERFCVGK
ncbi:MAG: tRNA uridine-5-carboxymethylaminomethyl(34) synthesis GTPase MnmE [Desulfomonilaceae bacterium]